MPDLNNPRCQICPMLEPTCAMLGCAMYGLPVSAAEKANPQHMYARLKQCERELLDSTPEEVGDDS